MVEYRQICKFITQKTNNVCTNKYCHSNNINMENQQKYSSLFFENIAPITTINLLWPPPKQKLKNYPSLISTILWNVGLNFGNVKICFWESSVIWIQLIDSIKDLFIIDQSQPNFFKILRNMTFYYYISNCACKSVAEL